MRSLQQIPQSDWSVIQGSQSAAHGNALPFAALNGALATDVACVVIPSGVHVQQPLHILYLSTGVVPSPESPSDMKPYLLSKLALQFFSDLWPVVSAGYILACSLSQHLHSGQYRELDCLYS